MGLFEGTQKDYYQGSNLGNYQFISLDDIITQFQIAYVGEGKIIPKIKIRRKINTLEEFQISCFIWMMNSNTFIRNVYHGGIFNFVNSVESYDSNSSPFCYKYNIVSFQKSYKSYIKG